MSFFSRPFGSFCPSKPFLRAGSEVREGRQAVGSALGLVFLAGSLREMDGAQPSHLTHQVADSESSYYDLGH